MLNILKNIFYGNNRTKSEIQNQKDISFLIDFVYVYEKSYTIKNAEVLFPANSNNIIINGTNYNLDLHYINDIGFSSDNKYHKIKTPDFIFSVTPKDFKSFKAILRRHHMVYIKNKRLEEKMNEQVNLDNNTTIEYDEINEDIYRCFIAYQSDMTDNMGVWNKFHKIEDRISNICSAKGGRYYRTPTKSAKFAIILNPHNNNYTSVKELMDKGFKVTTFENALSYFKLNHLWDNKTIK